MDLLVGVVPDGEFPLHGEDVRREVEAAQSLPLLPAARRRAHLQLALYAA